MDSQRFLTDYTPIIMLFSLYSNKWGRCMVESTRNRQSFNPFAWGTLFFTFWLTFVTIPNVGTFQTIIAWIFFGLSCFLWLVTFIPPLDKLIELPIAQKTILPLVFLASVFVWVIGSLTSLPQVPQSLRIIVPIGILMWSFAYMSIFIWSFKHVRLTKWVGIVVPALFILLGIVYFFRPVPLAQPWILIAIGVALLIVNLLKSKIGRNFPLI